MKKLCGALTVPALLCLTAALLLRSAETADAAWHAMVLAATVVVPGLFPFCVLSAVLVRTGAADRLGARLHPFMRRVFHVDGRCAAPLFLGTFCGYPIGAAAITELYQGGQISRGSAERAMRFCNNASPAFLVAVAGKKLLGSGTAGALLLLLQILSAILTGILLRGPALAPLRPVRREQKSAELLPAVTEAIRGAAVSMVQLSGFLVFFTVLLALLHPLAAVIPGAAARAVLAGLLEVTNGLIRCAALPCSLRTKFCLFSLLLGWSGLCVQAQALSFTEPLGLRAGPYLCGKCVQALLSLLLSLPLSLLLPQETFAFSAPQHSFGSFLVVLILYLALIPLFFFFHWKSSAKPDIMEKVIPGGDSNAVQKE